MEGDVSSDQQTWHRVIVVFICIIISLLLGLVSVFHKTSNLRLKTVLMHGTWSVPLVIMIGSEWFVEPIASDWQCKADKWRPMIGPISKLYIGNFGQGLAVSQHLKGAFGGALFINWFDRKLPNVTMPTMELHMNGSELFEREVFFLPNFAIALLTVMFALEVMNVFFVWVEPPLTRCYRTLDAKYKMYKAKQQGITTGLSEKLLKGEENVPVVSEESFKAKQQAANAVAPQGSDTGSDLQDIGITTRALRLSSRQLAYRAGFAFYYIVYQMAIYVWVDLTVAGGLINLQTSAAWEMWALFLQLELLVQFTITLLRYLLCFGELQQHPILVIIPTLLPWVGNSVHIAKDHLSQGLCFAVAHCATGLNSQVALVLGYLGFLATLHPILMLLSTPESREGLRAAHWPSAEVLPVQADNSKSSAWEKSKSYLMGVLISSCTEEKRMRAIHGEIPHTVIHVLFIYFFGSSAFVWFGLIISVLKIISIPLLKHFVIFPYIAKWECSHDNAQRFMVNFGDHERAIYNMALKHKWKSIIREWFLPARGSNAWVQIKDQMFLACGKIPAPPSLERLMTTVEHPLYSGNSDDYLDENDSTPLMYVVGPAGDETVAIVAELVYNQKANPNHVNKLGYNAFNYAKMWQVNQNRCPQEVLDILVAHGADPNDVPFDNDKQGPHKPTLS